MYCVWWWLVSSTADCRVRTALHAHTSKSDGERNRQLRGIGELVCPTVLVYQFLLQDLLPVMLVRVALTLT